MFTVFLPIQESWPFGRFFQNFEPFLLLFYVGFGQSDQVMVLGNFRCRPAIMLVQGPSVLAVGAWSVCVGGGGGGRGGAQWFSRLSSLFFSPSLSTEMPSQRAVKTKNHINSINLTWVTAKRS